MPAVVLQKLMGHSDVKITLNTYTSIFNDFKLDEINKVNAYYERNNLLDDKEDEFITTLKSIFGKRIAFCLDCNICNHYRQQHV